MKHGTYIGNRMDLKGKTALLRVNSNEKVSFYEAQFDDMTLKESHHWWPFEIYDFVVEAPNDFDLPSKTI